MIIILVLYELIFLDNLRCINDLYLRALLYTTITQEINSRAPLDDNNLDDILLRLNIIYSYICVLVDENVSEDLLSYTNLVFTDLYDLIKSRLELVKEEEDLEIYRVNSSTCYEIRKMWPYSVIMRIEDKTNYNRNKNNIIMKVVTCYDN